MIAPGSVVTVTLAGTVSIGGGFDTIVDADDELLNGLASPVVEETATLFVNVVSSPCEQLTPTTGRMTIFSPDDTDGFVQVMEPPDPTAGVVHVQPGGGVSETNETPAGSVLVSVTLDAGFGPPFVNVIGNLMMLPAGTVSAGAVVVTERSARGHGRPLTLNW
jgi:hypothetical protein